MRWVCERCDYTVYWNHPPRQCSQCGSSGVYFILSKSNRELDYRDA